MKNRFIFSLVTLFILSYFHINAESKERGKPDVKNPMFFVEKSNRGEKITSKEFTILITQLEQKLTDLKVASSKISTEGADSSNERGKIWEIELDNMQENIKSAFVHLNEVRNNPDSMASSLALYINLRDITATAFEFDKVQHFEKALKNTHLYLDLWSTSFQKAHLIPLAILKDKQPPLSDKKTKDK